MAHGFLCTKCGQQETAHTDYPDANTCDDYQSENIDVEARLWTTDMSPYCKAGQRALVLRARGALTGR